MNPLSWFEWEVFSAKLTLAMLHFIWQGCGIAIIAVVGNLFLKGGKAHAQCSLNLAALLLMAACLPITFSLVRVPEKIGGAPIDTKSPSDYGGSQVFLSPPASQPENAANQVDDFVNDNRDARPRLTSHARSDVNLAVDDSPLKATKRSWLGTLAQQFSSQLHMASPCIAVLYLGGVVAIFGRLLRLEIPSSGRSSGECG